MEKQRCRNKSEVEKRVVLRLIKELDAEGTIKTPLNGYLGNVVGVILYRCNSLSGDKYKS